MKRFLDALKAETFSHEVFSSFIEALTILIKCNMTAEVLRSLALFVTYALHQPTGPSARTPRTQYGTLPSRSATSSPRPTRPAINTVFDSKEEISAHLTKRQLGNRILKMYTGLLCEKGNISNIKKFARTVTNKVKYVYHFLNAILTIYSGFCTF